MGAPPQGRRACAAENLLASMIEDGAMPRPRVTVSWPPITGWPVGRGWMAGGLVLAQAGVNVSLVVSDDASTSATRSILRRCRVRSLSPSCSARRTGVTGRPAPVCDACARGSLRGLHRQDGSQRRISSALQLALMASHEARVSSSVTAFWRSLPGGGVKTSLTFVSLGRCAPVGLLFETAGPGSTYVFRPTHIVCWPR